MVARKLRQLSSPICVLALLCARAANAEQPAAPPDASREWDAPATVEARTAFTEGLRYLRDEQWAQAEASFRRSLALVPRPSTEYNLALVLFKQRRGRESLRVIERMLAAPTSAGEQRYREYAETLKPLVIGQLALLRVSVRPPNAQIGLDGEIVEETGAQRSLWLDPGFHRIEVTASGYAKKTLELEAKAGAEQRQQLELVRLPPPSAVRSSPVPVRSQASASTVNSLGPWLTIGAGSAVFIGGLVVGAFAKKADNEFLDECPSVQGCNRDLEDKGGKVKRLGHIADALLVSGGALIAGGVVWRVLTPSVQARNGDRALLISTGGRF
jgi:hypothetical protein